MGLITPEDVCKLVNLGHTYKNDGSWFDRLYEEYTKTDFSEEALETIYMKIFNLTERSSIVFRECCITELSKKVLELKFKKDFLEHIND